MENRPDAMDRLELVRHRRSVRTFDGKPLLPEDAEKILSFAEKIETPYGIPITWKLLSAREKGLSAPVIAGADTYIAGKLTRCQHAEEAFGYAFEKLVLYAESLGIGTTWIAGTMDRAAFERAMDVQPNEAMPCVSPLGYPAEKMSLREIMMRKGVRADSRLKFSELFFDRRFDAPLSDEPSENAPAAASGGNVSMRDVLEMIRLAPSAVNKQPWRVVLDGNRAHFYEKKNKGYTDTSGWDLQKVDVGIALYHFAFGMQEKVRLSIADPGIEAPADTVYIATMTAESL